jgi:hypothetical protein
MTLRNDLFAAIAVVDPDIGPTDAQTAAIVSAADAMIAAAPPLDLTSEASKEALAGLWKTAFTTHGIERGYATLQRMSWGHAKDTPVRSSTVHQFLDPWRGKYLNIVNFQITDTPYRGLHYARADVALKPEQPDTFLVTFRGFSFKPASDTPPAAFQELVAGADGALDWATPPDAPTFASPCAYLDATTRFMRGSDGHFYVLEKVSA